MRLPAAIEKKRPPSKANGGPLEVADIFRQYGPEFRANHSLSKKQHSVMFDIERCRTAELGYHVDVCSECGYTEHAYNSCHNRHCPKCQGITQHKWVKARLNDILPIPYYHAVFTLPHKIFPISLYNKVIFCELLFECAAQTLLQFGKDPRHLGALIGFYGILHTWGGKLWQHLHLHFIVTDGGLDEKGKWVEPKYKGKFLFPVCALSQVFRGKFIEGLKSAYYKGKLMFPDEFSHLKEPQLFEAWIDELIARDWVVFTKPPFLSPEEVVKYIGRYTHRVAISNNRLISIKDGQVRFRYKNYKKKGFKGYSWEEMTLPAEEFIRRFLMHILPEGFHRIRHFGFLANGRCKTAVKKIREMLAPREHKPSDLKDFAGIPCPVCKKGIMTPLLTVHRFGTLVFSASRLLCSSKPAWDTS
ncbi:MAG: IS91 family transposase [Thermodesulfobacteriota bacterium]|nr:IS91 family transposase [Thermodesulfobacteriota bacterium]